MFKPLRSGLSTLSLGILVSILALSTARGQTIPINWTSEGTFDASMLPIGTAVNTFSNSEPFDLSEVHFSHMIDALADGGLRLFDGTFTITRENGDLLHGTYQDFMYAAPNAAGQYLGSGPFTITGGTGLFANATGEGSWEAVAAFTSMTGGTADHIWSGTITIPEPSSVWLAAILVGAMVVTAARSRRLTATSR
jgi:hypothetical protein